MSQLTFGMTSGRRSEARRPSSPARLTLTDLRILLRWTVWAAAVALLGRPAVADWRQFRGPNGQGVAESEVRLPIEWNDQHNVAWNIQLPGSGASSPIVLNDRVYVTCYSGYGQDPELPGNMEDLRLHVVCVGLTDGQVHWKRTIQPELPETEGVRDHGYAAATPATDGERIFAFFGKTGVIALDLNGDVVWQTNVGTKTHAWGSGTSPVLFENLVIVNASVESESLIALDKDSGQIVWQVEGMQSSWNTPHLVRLPDGNVELAVSVRNYILGFDPATGQQLWTCDGIEDYVCPSLVSQEGIVYAIGGRWSQSMAIRAGGRGDVTDSHKLWQTSAGANVSSPVIDGAYIYWVSDHNRVAYCLNRHTGEIMYQERVPGRPYASAVLADDRLYVVTRFEGTFVIAAKPSFELLSRNQLNDDSAFNASPAVAEGSLLIRSDQKLFCIRQ